MENIADLLEALKKLVHTEPDKCFFNKPAINDEISELEYEFNIELPVSYKKFLKNFNGGFICSSEMAELLQKGTSMETASWNSILIFGLREIYVHYQKLRDNCWKLAPNWQGVYPFIPFCTTQDNELLIFVNPLSNLSESAVFDAFHEEFPSQWGLLFDSFTDFLANYIRFEGAVSTIASDCMKTAADFMPESDWKKPHQESDDPQEVEDFLNFMINSYPQSTEYELNLAEHYFLQEMYSKALEYADLVLAKTPREAFAFSLKSKIYKSKGQLNTALEMIKKALKINPDSVTFLLQLAEINLELGFNRKAENELMSLIKIDPSFSYTYYLLMKIYRQDNQLSKAKEAIKKAVEIDSGSALYLCVLAEVCFDLKQFDLAVKYCTESIKIDPEFVSPFITREKTFRQLGKKEEADKDIERINELL